jgi:predicted nucleic acid-binding protein
VIQPVKYLLDTNVISELRVRRLNSGVAQFFSTAVASSLYLSVLTLGELRKGALQKRRTDPEGARQLITWLTGLEEIYAERIFPVDQRIATLWGKLSADRSRPVVDTLLAATALAHDLTLVTRNVKDVSGLGVKLLNPWS